MSGRILLLKNRTPMIMGIKAEGRLKPWREPMKDPMMIKKTGQLNNQDGMKNISSVRSNNIHPIASITSPTNALPDF